MIWYAFNTHPALFLLTVMDTVLLIWLLVSKRIQIKECLKFGVLLFTTIFGFSIGRLYNAGGSSEMYFTMAIYIPCVAYNLEVYRESLNRGAGHIKWMDIPYKLVLVSASIIGLYCWGLTDWLGGIIEPLGTGYDRIKGNWEASEGSDKFTEREAEAIL